MFRSTLNRCFASTALLMAEKGKCVSWMNNRGFGFIEDDADKKQHFVHFSALKVEAGGFRALTTGQEVEFDIASQDGRTRAENVTAPGGSPLPSGPRPPMGMGGGRGGDRGGRGGGRGFGRGRGGDRRRDDNNSGGMADDF